MNAQQMKMEVGFLTKTLGALGVLVSLLSANVGQATVEKSGRVLVVVSELDSRVAPELRGLYQIIEQLTQVTAGVTLGSEYAQVRVLKNSQATLANYAATLRALARNPSVQAIDTILSVHGSAGSLLFAEGSQSMGALERAVLPAGMPTAERATLRRKLRIMYNLSCFGQSHNRTFFDIGYDIVAGSKGVNANAEVEFVPVLTNIRLGGRFVDGFAPSNNDVALSVADAPLRLAGNLAQNALRFTDSKKVFTGFSATRINTDARP